MRSHVLRRRSGRCLNLTRVRFKFLNLITMLAAIKQSAPKAGYTFTHIALLLESAADILIIDRRSIQIVQFKFAEREYWPGE
jgi:hypothetical protein